MLELARIHRAAGARRIVPLLTPPLDWQDGRPFDPWLAELGRRPISPNRVLLFTAHQMGTCGIGSDRRDERRRPGRPGVGRAGPLRDGRQRLPDGDGRQPDADDHGPGASDGRPDARELRRSSRCQPSCSGPRSSSTASPTNPATASTSSSSTSGSPRSASPGSRPPDLPDLRVIDLAGRTLMPGLIDAHVHPSAAQVIEDHARPMPTSLRAQYARIELEAMLRRGFTTARDAGGCDVGIKMAIERGLIDGPRLLVSGKALSQTGGHGDDRAVTDGDPPPAPTRASSRGSPTGSTRSASPTRQELRRGADQIKICASGGVMSETDPVEMTQYSEPEIRAIVDEAASRGTYVLAHAYGADAIGRAVRCGVRSIEHANLIDAAGGRRGRRARRVRRADDGHLRRARGARSGERRGPAPAGQERRGARGGARGVRDPAGGRRQGRLRHATCSATCAISSRSSSRSAPRSSGRPTSSARRPR